MSANRLPHGAGLNGCPRLDDDRLSELSGQIASLRAAVAEIRNTQVNAVRQLASEHDAAGAALARLTETVGRLVEYHESNRRMAAEVLERIGRLESLVAGEFEHDPPAEKRAGKMSGGPPGQADKNPDWDCDDNEQILNVFYAAGKPLKAASVANRLKMSVDHVRRKIYRMHDQGLLSRDDDDYYSPRE